MPLSIISWNYPSIPANELIAPMECPKKNVVPSVANPTAIRLDIFDMVDRIPIMESCT